MNADQVIARVENVEDQKFRAMTRDMIQAMDAALERYQGIPVFISWHEFVPAYTLHRDNQKFIETPPRYAQKLHNALLETLFERNLESKRWVFRSEQTTRGFKIDIIEK